MSNATTYNPYAYDDAEHQVDNDEIDLRDLMLLLWRKRVMILVIFFAGLIASLAFATTLPPRYTAKALLVIGDGSQGGMPGQELLTQITGSSFGQGSILNEIEIIKSRRMAAKIVEKLNLVNDPELGTVGVKNKGSKSPLESGFKDMAVNGDQFKVMPPEALNENISITITNFLRALKVNSITGSSAIVISFDSENPHKAALIVNTLADTYKEHKKALKDIERQKRTGWLEQRLKVVRDQVFGTETEIEKLKAEHNLMGEQGGMMSVQELTKLQQGYIKAQAEYLEVKVRLEQLEKQNNLDALAGSYALNTNVGVINQLQIQKQNLQSSLSELSKRYGEKHPKIIKTKAELNAVTASFRNELRNAKQKLKNELGIIQARMDEISTQMDKIREAYNNTDMAPIVKLREMEREAETLRMVLRTMLETQERIAGQEALTQSNIDILSYASVPREAAQPNKKLIVSMSALMSLFIAIALSILVEKMANIYYRPEQIEKGLGLPVYTELPATKKLKGTEFGDYILEDPSSKAAEAVRSLNVALKVNKATEGAQVITMTSCENKRRKTALAVWLARMSAKSGEKVILIDANLRNPLVHTMLGISNSPSLVDYLSGQEQVEAVIQKDSSTGMNVITGQAIPNTAFDLLNSKRMATLIEALKATYDTIIIDTPPSAAVPDARVIAKHSDNIVYMVVCDKSKRYQVIESLKNIAEGSNAKIGCVFSRQK